MMETKKLEQIIIIILALLNVFLLIVVLSDALQSRNSRQDTVETLTALLEERGIAVGPEADLLQSSPAQCTVLRDLELEQRRMQGLLGDHTSEDLGGSIWFYASDTGQLRMRGTGEFDMLLSEGGALRGHSPAKAAEELFARGSVTLYDAGLGTDVGENSVTLCCCWNGYPVYNAMLTFDYSNDRIYMVSGTMVFNMETETGTAPGMDAVSVLVRFMELVESEGWRCGRLDALMPGYYMNVAISGESTLTPVWRISTDTGDYYINAVSGKTEFFTKLLPD